jgi:hypothetical protein
MSFNGNTTTLQIGGRQAAVSLTPLTYQMIKAETCSPSHYQGTGVLIAVPDVSEGRAVALPATERLVEMIQHTVTTGSEQ